MKIMALVSLLPALVFTSSAIGQPVSNGQNADVVLGQANFFVGVSGTSAIQVYHPRGAVVDPTTGKLFVADYFNCRVLRWSSANAAVSGSAAEAVLGQTSFITSPAGQTQNTMYNPFHLFVDGAGRLWVADLLNNRVLRFDNASFKSSGASADGVLGQPDFTKNSTGTTSTKMNGPSGVTVDQFGRLFVADANNHRVLRFDNAAFKSNGASADGVLGQPHFTTSNANTNADGMNYPYDVAINPQGTLFVCDNLNNRILRFDNAASKSNGASADGVLGQNDFTSNIYAVAQSRMYSPQGISLDAKGHLFVADGNNNRVLIFNAAAGKQNGANADAVLGQSDFTSGGNSVISQNTLSQPNGVGVDTVNNKLWVVDTYNNRLLRFTINIAPGIASSKASLPFPDRAVGDSALATIYIRATTSASLTIIGASTTTNVFSISLSLPANIKGNDSIAVTIKFKPSSFGLFADSLKIVSNGGTIVISLNGASPDPQLVLGAGALNFGSVDMDSISSQQLKITNPSINRLRIDSIKTSSNDFFAQGMATPAYVKFGDTLRISIAFFPHGVGNYADTLELTSNSLPPTVRIPLTGVSKITTEVKGSKGSGVWSYELRQNYPNPFNPETVIPFSVPQTGELRDRFVSLRIFDVLGKEVSTLVNEEKKPGNYTVRWDANGFPSGVYFCKFSAGDFAETKKMIFMK